MLMKMVIVARANSNSNRDIIDDIGYVRNLGYCERENSSTGFEPAPN